MEKQISYKQELLRKSIHLLSLSIPIIYYFQSKEFVLSVLVPLAIISVILDYISKEGKPLNHIFMKYFGAMMREHEVKKMYTVNGASWVLITSVLVFGFFPKEIAITVFTILIISDMIAALVGRKYGKHRLFTKSWEGTIAFILSAFVIVYIWGAILDMPALFFIFACIGSVFGGIIEAASAVLKLDDNFSIPVSIGSVIWLGELYAQSIGQSFINIF